MNNALFRHAPGAGSRVTAPERREIQQAHLIEGLNRSALAIRFGRTRETIAAQLQGDDFDQLRAEIDRGEAEDAKAILHRHRIVAANSWAAAVSTAAGKGDHRPAKDLLLHTRTIDPVLLQGQTHIAIIFAGSPEVPGLPSSSGKESTHVLPNESGVIDVRVTEACESGDRAAGTVGGAPPPTPGRSHRSDGRSNI
jgi:hypothetical protein